MKKLIILSYSIFEGVLLLKKEIEEKKLFSSVTLLASADKGNMEYSINEFLSANTGESFVLLPVFMTKGQVLNTILSKMEKKISISVLDPLLEHPKASALLADFLNCKFKGARTILIAHGSESGNDVYLDFAKKLSNNITLQFIHGGTNLENFKKIPSSEVTLSLLMFSCGFHGKKELSLDGAIVKKLNEQGVNVNIIPKGLLEYEEMRKIYKKILEEDV